MAKTIGKFEDDVKIDRFRLEEENEAQPALYSYYASRAAEARNARDAAKDNVTAVKANRLLHYNRNPPADIKISIPVVDALVEADADYLAAKEALRVAEAQYGILDAAVSAMDHRKSALNNLVELWTKEYYNGQKTPGGSPLSSRQRRNEE